jgi:nucleoside-triphosphatase
MARTLLLTGSPGVGKTTVMRRVAEQVADRSPRGFLTDEIRREGRRLGFELSTFDGITVTLAHVDIRSKRRVGRYGVDVEALDRVVESAFTGAGLLLVDEIGKMECFSDAFVRKIHEVLDSDRVLVATVAMKGAGLIGQIKRRPDVELWTITHANRDDMPGKVLQWLK